MTILTDRQKILLAEIRSNSYLRENFYLTGGTALAEFYLNHRYSEDLDFFSEKEIDVLNLDIFFKSLKKSLSLTLVDFQQSYNRNLFFLHYSNGEVLKTEFTYFPFSKIEKELVIDDLKIDSLLDIAVNKLFSIYQRTYARDYIDLYLICKDKKWEVADLIKKARIKFDWQIDPLQLGTQFLKAELTEDYPKIIIELDHKEWKKFFLKEADKLKNEIFE